MIVVDLIKNKEGDVYAKLSYEPRKNYLIMKWTGPCSEEEVKAASMRMLDWQKREGLRAGCRFHVHDTKEIEGAWSGLVDWISNYFFPLNYEYGLRYNISIISPDLFSKMSSLELKKKSSGKIITILCETISQAESWILEHSSG
ncbi:hypothetical protein D1164_13455 [Mariniphaga sediminis]|jgi:hypothetical protein|uniref:STAS/SEC14 domain-containing protein n=1 Tax=Mariniphaga sediminis TaxID=1628158 RepID=A0A399CZQ8_9BACT|nr:hypothetical protein [Mariniphaga sediminis]RIH64643.1 hypothetical protein D1164_13455 [Mariniphaga sediminis]